MPKNFIRDLEKGNVDGFIERFEAMFADGDYRVAGNMEIYFQNCMFVIAKMLGFYTEVEFSCKREQIGTCSDLPSAAENRRSQHTTSHGRIDLTIQTPDYIYILWN